MAPSLRYEEALADMRLVVTSGANSAQASAACSRLTKYVAANCKGSTTSPSHTAPAIRPPPPHPPVSGGGASSEAAREAASAARVRGTEAFKAGDFKRSAEAYYEACKKEPEVSAHSPTSCPLPAPSPVTSRVASLHLATPLHQAVTSFPIRPPLVLSPLPSKPSPMPPSSHPQNHLHCSNLAIALLKLGQPQHAATAAARCVELCPTFPKGHYRLGQALRSRGDVAAAAAAYAAGVKHASGRELTEMTRELKACEAEMARNGSGGGSRKPQVDRAGEGKVEGEVESMKDSEKQRGDAGKAQGGSEAKVRPKGRVDLHKAQETARRIAMLAKKNAAPPATFSAFERGLRAAWQEGRGGEGLGEYLSALPREREALAKFVGESLSDDFLETVVQAADSALPTEEGVMLLGNLCELRRFEVGWMMAGSRAKAAVTRILQAAATLPALALSPGELKKLASKYDCKI